MHENRTHTTSEDYCSQRREVTECSVSRRLTDGALRGSRGLTAAAAEKRWRQRGTIDRRSVGRSVEISSITSVQCVRATAAAAGAAERSMGARGPPPRRWLLLRPTAPSSVRRSVPPSVGPSMAPVMVLRPSKKFTWSRLKANDRTMLIGSMSK